MKAFQKLSYPCVFPIRACRHGNPSDFKYSSIGTNSIWGTKPDFKATLQRVLRFPLKSPLSSFLHLPFDIPSRLCRDFVLMLFSSMQAFAHWNNSIFILSAQYSGDWIISFLSIFQFFSSSQFRRYLLPFPLGNPATCRLLPAGTLVLLRSWGRIPSLP